MVLPVIFVAHRVTQGVLLSDEAALVIVKEPPLSSQGILLYRFPARRIDLPRFVRIALGILTYHAAKSVIDVADDKLAIRIPDRDDLALGIVLESVCFPFGIDR